MRGQPPSLKVQLLGEFRCWRGQELISHEAWKTAKIRALFAMLVSERGRLFTPAELIGQLWPGTESEKVYTSLRRRISDLRRILEPRLKQGRQSYYVLQHAYRYSFNVEAQCWIDVEEFARLEREGQHQEHRAAWPLAITAYNKALQLYRGEYFAEDRYEDWAKTNRDYWRDRCLYVITRLAECYSRLGHYQEAIGACRQALQVAPHYEEGQRRLMLYYYLWGERTQALKTYEDYRQKLAEELGLSPSLQMEELRRQIMQGTVLAPPRPPPPDDPIPHLLSLAHLPFVGRETERAQLQKHLREAQAGQGRLVLLRGEPGVGKTRLAQEVLREVQRDGALVLWGRCREDATNSPYLPLAGALRDGLLHLKYEDLAPIKPVWLTEIAVLTPELRTLLPQLPQNPALAPQQAQWRLWEAVAQFLIELAQSPRFAKPLVLWLDDLQWAAPALLNLLDYLRQRTAGMSICLVGAYRSTEVTHSLHKKLIAGCKPSDHIVLSRLSYAAIEQMLAQVGPKLPSEFSHFVYRESEGNSLFVTALLQEFFDRKVLTVAADGRWVCKKIDPLKSFTARGMRAVFRQRLVRLSLTEQRLLQLAAVIGREFDYELLKAAWGQADRELDNSLKRVGDAGLLAVIGPGLRYDFTHDRIREIVADEIGAERPLLHRRVARAIERLHAPELSSYYGPLAYHYDRAGEFSSALRYSLSALEQAVARYHHDEALRMAEIGLRAAQALSQPASAFQILAQRVEIYHRLGRRKEQERDIERLFTVGARCARPRQGKPCPYSIEAYRARAVFCRAVGRYAESVEAARKMLELLRRQKDRKGEAKALLLLGPCYWLWGQYNRALECAERARTLTNKIGDRAGLGDALHFLGAVHAHTGAHRGALHYYLQASKIRRETGNQPGAAYTLSNLGNAYRAFGKYQKALDAYGQSLAIHEEVGDEQGRGRVLSDFGDLYGFLGNYEKSLQYAKQAQAIQKVVRDLDNSAQTHIVLGRVHQGLGQLQKALSSFKRAQVLFEQLKNTRGVCHALDSIGAIELELGHARRALRSYQAALSRLETLGARDVQIECLMGISLVQRELGQKVRALHSSRRAVELLEAGVGHVHPQHAYFVHHLTLRASRRDAEAQKYLQKAYDEVMRCARTIRDRELRESFLSRVKANRAIVAAWRK